jgi:hypothetical protein
MKILSINNDGVVSFQENKTMYRYGIWKISKDKIFAYSISKNMVFTEVHYNGFFGSSINKQQYVGVSVVYEMYKECTRREYMRLLRKVKREIRNTNCKNHKND